MTQPTKELKGRVFTHTGLWISNNKLTDFFSDELYVDSFYN